MKAQHAPMLLSLLRFLRYRKHIDADMNGPPSKECICRNKSKACHAVSIRTETNFMCHAFLKRNSKLLQKCVTLS